MKIFQNTTHLSFLELRMHKAPLIFLSCDEDYTKHHKFILSCYEDGINNRSSILTAEGDCLKRLLSIFARGEVYTKSESSIFS